MQNDKLDSFELTFFKVLSQLKSIKEENKLLRKNVNVLKKRVDAIESNNSKYT